MEDEDRINIKLELSKDKNQNLSIITYFNTNSSNFIKEGDYYLWRPTLKEKEFMIDAFKLIMKSNQENKEDMKIFKFSNKNLDNTNKKNENLNYDSADLKEDKIININVDSKLKENQIIEKINQDKIINKTINNNLNKFKTISEEEREKKIEKILNENKKNKY
jgi:hypothetical protein